MKNRILLLGLCGLLAACSSNVSQYKEPLEELDAEWKETAASLTKLQRALQAELQDWEGMYSGMEAPDQVQAQLTEAQRDRLDDLKERCQGHGESYAEMIDEVASLQLEWKEEEAKLNELLRELEAGKIRGNGRDRLDELREELREVREEIKVVQEEVKFTKAECLETCQSFADIVTSVNVQ